MKRGESKSELVEDSTVHCFVWQDKKAVSFINTIFDVTDECQVKRKNKDGSQSLILCPRAVKEYNNSMGGVDIADAKRKAYSCSRRSKKWWHRLFYFLLNICIVNAHIIQSESPHQTNITQKEFRIELARELMSSYNARKHRKRGRNSNGASPSLVFSDNHFPDKLEKPAQLAVLPECDVALRTAASNAMQSSRYLSVLYHALESITQNNYMHTLNRLNMTAIVTMN